MPVDFRCTLTDEEHDRKGRIADHYKRTEGIRGFTAVFRAWMLKEDKEIKLKQAKEKAGRA